jgi:hypothetical protein
MLTKSSQPRITKFIVMSLSIEKYNTQHQYNNIREGDDEPKSSIRAKNIETKERVICMGKNYCKLGSTQTIRNEYRLDDRCSQISSVKPKMHREGKRKTGRTIHIKKLQP